MKSYAFDVKLFSVLRVSANSEEEARAKLTKLLDCATVRVGDEGYDEVITGEASVDGELDLIEEEDC